MRSASCFLAAELRFAAAELNAVLGEIYMRCGELIQIKETQVGLPALEVGDPHSVDEDAGMGTAHASETDALEVGDAAVVIDDCSRDAEEQIGELSSVLESEGVCA